MPFDVRLSESSPPTLSHPITTTTAVHARSEWNSPTSTQSGEDCESKEKREREEEYRCGLELAYFTTCTPKKKSAPCEDGLQRLLNSRISPSKHRHSDVRVTVDVGTWVSEKRVMGFMVIYSQRSPSACFASCPLWQTHTHTLLHSHSCEDSALTSKNPKCRHLPVLPGALSETHTQAGFWCIARPSHRRNPVPQPLP